jgi:hypothetical protein
MMGTQSAVWAIIYYVQWYKYWNQYVCTLDTHGEQFHNITYIMLNKIGPFNDPV